MNIFLIWKRKIFYRKSCIYFIRLDFIDYQLDFGFSIPINVFGKGLSIAHYGSIVVNSNAKVGR